MAGKNTDPDKIAQQPAHSKSVVIGKNSKNDKLYSAGRNEPNSKTTPNETLENHPNVS